MSRKCTMWMVVLMGTAMVVPAIGQSKGEDTYKGKCAMCHGADGLANTPTAKAMKVPSVKSPEFQKLTESEMVTATTDGKGKMPAYKGKLSETQIHDVVTYMRSLEKK